MNQTTSIPTQAGALPAISGLQFRQFAGESDFPAMLEIYNAAWNEDHAERIATPDWIRAEYLPDPNFDPARDVLIAEVAGKMVAHSDTRWWVVPADHNVILHSYGFVHPDWRHKGIGRAMLRANQAHLYEVATQLQEKYSPSDWTFYFGSTANNFQSGNLALLKSEGFQPIRQSYMMRRPNLDHIPDLPLPDGLEVRPVQPEQYHQVWEASQEAFRDHWGYSEPSEESFQNWLKSPLFQPELWQVAWEGDQVAGMVQNFIVATDNAALGQKRGWTEGISVRRPWRRRGLARALLARSIQMHRDLGMTETALGVDAENPNGARQLYESMGYQTFRVNITYRKPVN